MNKRILQALTVFASLAFCLAAPAAEKKAKATKKKAVIKNLNVGINEFGELTSSVRFDDINTFLNKTVQDRKLDEKKEKEKADKKKK